MLSARCFDESETQDPTAVATPPVEDDPIPATVSLAGRWLLTCLYTFLSDVFISGPIIISIKLYLMSLYARYARVFCGHPFFLSTCQFI